MGQAADRQDAAAVDEVFDHPAFADLKSQAAAFVVLRPASGDLLWANAPAAAWWNARDDALRAVLLGPPGRGWLGSATAAVAPGRVPQMLRTGLVPGLKMRGSVVLARAVAGPDGRPVVGVAVPGSGADGARPEAWRKAAAADADPVPAASPDGPPPSPEALPGNAGTIEEPAEPSLAARSHAAVLRDRLAAAIGGAATLRFLWRTDAEGALTHVDDALPARLGAPLRPGPDGFPHAVARFDPAAAERLGEAIARRAPWSGVPIRMPVADGGGTVQALLSGSPVFGRDRGFQGFRGFGVLQLAALEATPRVPTASGTATPEPIPAPESPDPPPPAFAEPAPRDPATDRQPFANVVDLRSFQAVRSGAPGAADPTPSDPLETVAAPPDPAPGAEPAESAGGSPGDVPAGDEAAFLALGAALRAQIGEDARRDEGRPEGSIAPVPGATSLPAAAGAMPLLDGLSVPVLVWREGAPVFANPAAARALGFDTADGVVAAGADLLVGRTPAGLTLRTGRGDSVSAAAEPLSVDWQGAEATLWTFAPGLAAEPEPRTDPLTEPRPESDDRAVDLIDRVDDAVALLDGEGRVRRLNEQGRVWFGDAATGEPLTALLAPDSRATATGLLEEARSRDAGGPAVPPRRDVSARLADGAAMPMRLTLGRLGAAGFYATLREVPVAPRAERDEAPSRGERDIGRVPDLLARVSHEIRTPLNAILGFAEVMMDERFGPLGSPRYRDYLKDIHASGTQVVALVGDLLDLSRIEAGRIDLAVGAVDVNKIVAEIVAQMQPEANRERVIVRTSLASRIPPVLVDEGSARQIVQHLLSNAVKFNEPGGQVIVSTAQDEGGAVVLRIRDTGVGMTEAEIAAALEPFHELSPPRPANGNGLGLPLARALVGANGASLSIRSRPREGTLVEVSFPPAPPQEARRPA